MTTENEVRPTLLTDNQVAKYQATASKWSESNPYRARLLALRGGLHAPSRTEDRHTRRDDATVELLRETAEAKREGGCAF